jgi:hypothetical protein
MGNDGICEFRQSVHQYRDYFGNADAIIVKTQDAPSRQEVKELKYIPLQLQLF